MITALLTFQRTIYSKNTPYVAFMATEIVLV